MSAEDWPLTAAREVVSNLDDRRGLGFDEVDEETMAEIVEAIADIIRKAARAK